MAFLSEEVEHLTHEELLDMGAHTEVQPDFFGGSTIIYRLDGQVLSSRYEPIDTAEANLFV